MSDAPQVIAEFSDAASLLHALRQARELRDVSYECLDEVAGLPRGYTSKVLSPNGQRRPTLQSLPWLLGALACKCQIVSDDEAPAQIGNRLVPRAENLVRSGVITLTLSRRFLSKIGRKGATSQWAKAKQRAEVARRAANARWNGNGGSQRNEMSACGGKADIARASPNVRL